MHDTTLTAPLPFEDCAEAGFVPSMLLPGSAFELERGDANFPEVLLGIEDAPKRLYGVGCEDALETGIAVIGARNATPYGMRAAQLVASWAAELGLVVYSGCARGCDQAAHRGALEAGGRTVAVMGCGADVVYPKRADKLLGDIAKHGAVISEYRWNTPPRRFRFRERNRLIAALSLLVVVTEARLPSGTLSAVHHALDLGVAVAAVPGSIFCLESAAPNRLISEGAFPLCCRQDLAFACGLSSSRENVNCLFRLESERSTDFDDQSDDAISLIRRTLQSMPFLPDELAEELDISLAEVIEILGHLEVQGQVKRYPDGRYGIGDFV